MNKAHLFVISSFLLVLPLALAEPLKAHVVWTADRAKDEAFRHCPATTGSDIFSPDMVDPNLIANKQALSKGGGRVGTRNIIAFDDGSYGVDDQNFPATLYFWPNGKLKSLDVNWGAGYPSGLCKYAVGEWAADMGIHSGQLASISINVTADNQYVFLPNGALHAHWIGSKCFFADGSSCGTRDR